MSDTNNDLWKPSENSVVCSIHFADNQPTPSNPWPTLHLGYDARENLRSLERRKPRVKPVTTPSASTSTSIPCSTQQNIADDHLQETTFSANLPQEDPTLLPDSNLGYSAVEVKPKLSQLQDFTNNEMVADSASQCEKLTDEDSASQCKKLMAELNIAKGKLLRCELQLKEKSYQLKRYTKPIYQQLLNTDSDVMFYTGIPALCTFNLICKYVRNILRTINKKPVSFNVKLKYKKLKQTPERKLKLIMEDRVLLVLMKLRLALLHKDLAHR